MRPSVVIIMWTIGIVALAAMRLWTLAGLLALTGPVVAAVRIARIVRRMRRHRDLRRSDAVDA